MVNKEFFTSEFDCTKCSSDNAGFDGFGNIYCPDCNHYIPNPLNQE